VRIGNAQKFGSWLLAFGPLAFASLVSGSCREGSPNQSSEPMVDTLPDGSVLVTNPEEGLWDIAPERRWQIVETLRLGDSSGQGPDDFEEVGSVLVDELGRMWVADVMASEIRVFDESGRFVRAVGRPGEGPSEFRRIGPVFAGPDGEVWVEDLSLLRWEVFDSAGIRAGGHRILSGLPGGWRKWVRDELFLVMDEGSDGVVMRVMHTGNAGTLEAAGDSYGLPEPPKPNMVSFESPDGRIEVPAPFASRGAGTLGLGLDFWFSDGVAYDGHYEIKRLDLAAGESQFTIRRRYAPVGISDSVRSDALAALRERYAESVPASGLGLAIVPREYPPLDGLFVSADSTLWVLRTLGDDRIGFDVFGDDGRYLGQPEMLADLSGLRIQAITHDAIYAIDTDNLGVTYVVRMDIRRPAP